MSTDVMIYANGLTKRYGSFRALDNVSFEVSGARSSASSARTAPASRPRCAS